MEKEMDIRSVLTLEKLLFDKIEFQRKGFKSNQAIEFKIGVTIDKKSDENVYRVHLALEGNKEQEYTIEIAAIGYFSFDNSEDLSEERKSTLINKNAVAIMMPYLRSEVSLLTAQPEVDCVVLPPFNVSKLLDQD